VPISTPGFRNPVADLQPALAAITQAGVRVLPATGQAIEDLMRPDQDESYDRVRLGPSALEVDTYLARIGQALGFKVENIYVARRRGNSAQQMGKHGRVPQRESVVVFRAPGCTDVDATTSTR
jgi:hypothetical protein